MEAGERQVAPTLAGIREDHLARYHWAAGRLAGKKVVDAGCGVGYGSLILAEAGCKVLALDSCTEALAYAAKHYAHENITYVEADLAEYQGTPTYDAVIAFEVLEHLKAPGMALANFINMAPELLTSVPNEAVMPYSIRKNHRTRFHERHYTAQEFEELLNGASWEVQKWFGQKGKRSDVEPLVNGRTLVVVAGFEREPAGNTHLQLPPPPAGPPARVAIVAMGASKSTYLEYACRGGGRHAEWDEVWAVNSTGGVVQHDRLFHMDDVLVQERRTALNPEVKGLMDWMQHHPGPVYTSTTSADMIQKAVELRTILHEGHGHTVEGQTTEELDAVIQEQIDYLEETAPLYDRYPGLVSYPLKEVLESTGAPYLNNTVAMAIAYALHIGVKTLSLFGVDFTYPDAHISEKGRACCEFLLGLAAARGMEVRVPETTTLLDANMPDKFYGYDAWTVRAESTPAGVRIIKTPKDLPTAEEMEERYRKTPKEVAA